MLALAVLVLGGNVFHVIGLAASGVSWTSGELAFGVQGGDASSFLPPGLSHLVEGVTVMAVLLSPLLVVPMGVVAAWLLWSKWMHRSAVDTFAIGALMAVGALVVLLAYWGDELWVWILD
jgi:hypothetical protein